MKKLLCISLLCQPLMGCNNESGSGLVQKQILSTNVVEIAVNELYNLSQIVVEDFQNEAITFNIADNQYVNGNQDDGIIKGIKIGSTTIKVKTDKHYQNIKVNVKDESELKTSFTTDKARLFMKKFTVMGASNSDLKARPMAEGYDTAKGPKFWCLNLEEDCYMTHYNHAKGGSTSTYQSDLIAGSPSYIDFIGVAKINQQAVIDSITNSDYLFFNFGGNEFNLRTEIGQIGDVNDKNYLTKESILGAFSYMIDKAYSYNPDIRIVILSLSTTHSKHNFKYNHPTKNHAKTRIELNGYLKTLAEQKNVKFINIYGLWEESDEGFKTYCADGIHMTDAGHKLVAQKIYNS